MAKDSGANRYTRDIGVSGYANTSAPTFDSSVDITHPTLDWDRFEGIDIKVGNEVVTLTKKEIQDALTKLFPDLVAKMVLARLARQLQS